MHIASPLNANNTLIYPYFYLTNKALEVPDNVILNIFKHLHKTKSINSFKKTCKSVAILYYKNNSRDQLYYLHAICPDLYKLICLKPALINSISLLNKFNRTQTKEIIYKSLISSEGRIYRLLMNTKDIADSLKGAYQGHIMAEIAGVLIYSSPSQAINLAHSIEDEDWRSYALYKISTVLAPQDATKALEVAKPISISSWKAKAYAKCSEVFFNTNPELANKVLEGALSLSKLIESSWEKFEVVFECLTSLNKQKGETKLLKKEAMEMAYSFEDAWRKSTALRMMAELNSKIDPKEAERLLKLSFESTCLIPTTLSKVDSLANNYRFLFELDNKKLQYKSITKIKNFFDKNGKTPVKANKLLNKIIKTFFDKKTKTTLEKKVINFCKAVSYIDHSTRQNTYLETLSLLKIAENLPYELLKKNEHLLDILECSGFYIAEKENRGHILAEIAKVRSRLHPNQALIEISKITSSYSKAVAYCHAIKTFQQDFL